MSEDLYAKPDLTKKVRFQAGEKKDGNTDVGENIDNVTIYDNSWAEGSAAPKSEDDTSDHQQPSICLSVWLWLQGKLIFFCWGILYISYELL